MEDQHPRFPEALTDLNMLVGVSTYVHLSFFQELVKEGKTRRPEALIKLLELFSDVKDGQALRETAYDETG
jgi:hypothetical protein